MTSSIFKTATRTVAGLALGVLMAGQAFASQLNLDANGVAVKGYDVVAYFTDSKPVKGTDNFKSSYEGATYLFASADHKAKFDNNPAAFVPAYGGWCAIGTANGLKIDIQPDLFKIVDNQLYLNTAPGAHEYWLTDVPGFIKKANTIWPTIKNVAANELSNCSNPFWVA